MKKNGNRAIMVILLALVMTWGFSGKAKAAGSVAISSSNFPDDSFREYVGENFDTDWDGVLSQTEISLIKEVDVDAYSDNADYAEPIASLKGIEYFTALERLYCSENELTSLDVTACRNLEELNCCDNYLTSLNVSTCSALEHLSCSGNSLTSLDLSGCASLNWLNTVFNEITELNISGCPLLILAYEADPEGTPLDEDGEIICYRSDEAMIECDHYMTIVTTAPGPAITTQPKGASAAVGDTVKFSIKATGTGLKYQWQYKYPNGSWTNSGYASAKTATLQFAAQAKYNGIQYRCKVRDSSGKTVTSSTAKLTITPKITVQPKSTSAAVGATAKFSISATGAGLKYQWQYKYPNESWNNSGYASGKTATLQFSALAKYNGVQYRCKVTDTNGKTVTSSAVKLTIDPTITAQPKSTGAAVGATAKFSISATGAGLKYQWQYKYPNGSWTNSGYASGKTATLQFSALAKYNGVQYRCKVTDANGKTLTSSAVKLTITPKITVQPKSISVTAGNTAKFSVTATGAGLKYQWQYKYPNGSWTNSGYASGKTATLQFSALAKYNGVQYRCVITDANGKTVTSSAVKLTVR
ncbi:MAG: hypothetical protein IJK86_08850 [Lachnospiraceae bacterium]|nr:hypothetical protein [Lachnospiraceae bacterium]